MQRSRRIVIIAGPNGAGKTTFAREFLPKEANCPDFINVDLIAAGLSPFDPDRAARVTHGGHNVPEDVIRRRFDAGLRNFERLYRKLVDRWVLYDNSGPTPRRIAAGDNL